MTTVFSKKALATEEAPKYADKIKDDVYVVRNGAGNEWHLRTREEMLEFKSCYIEKYVRYSPHERAYKVFMAFLKLHNIMWQQIGIEHTDIEIINYEGKKFKITIKEEEQT
jgi:hypothetical protein